MKRGTLAILLGALLVIAPLTAASAMNCVQYVRSASTFALSGNAWLWWYHAAGVYPRGHRPEKGAVMVFQRTRRLRDGHVALVARVLNRDTVLLDQANWAWQRARKGRVALGVKARDCSRHHDWSAVCVWNARAKTYGRPYPITGFIYHHDEHRYGHERIPQRDAFAAPIPRPRLRPNRG